MARRPKRDDAPKCPDKNCHEAPMSDIVKQGAIWFYKCPKCGRMLSACYCTETSPAMKDFMRMKVKK
jgi:hypothetical protein